jgi:hypothetical protein
MVPNYSQNEMDLEFADRSLECRMDSCAGSDFVSLIL